MLKAVKILNSSIFGLEFIQGITKRKYPNSTQKWISFKRTQQVYCLFSGSLTIADLYAVLYPTASVAVINVTGTALLQALETSVARYDMAATEELTEFLQVSGKTLLIYNLKYQTKVFYY